MTTLDIIMNVENIEVSDQSIYMREYTQMLDKPIRAKDYIPLINATKALNHGNMKNNFIGVYKTGSKYRAVINYSNQTHVLGHYDTEEAAAIMRYSALKSMGLLDPQRGHNTPRGWKLKRTKTHKRKKYSEPICFSL